MGQNTSSAVMAQRVEPHDSLDYFPTPPWATRALCEWLQETQPVPLNQQTVWEPACGEGYMARPLAEYFGSVHASDIHQYGDHAVEDFLWPGWRSGGKPDWIVTNPPFRVGAQFADQAIGLSCRGAAMLVRTAFLEGVARHAELFAKRPPSDILQFCERVPMVKGRVDPGARSATAYCWLVWRHDAALAVPVFHWIPPCRKQLERPGDYA